MNEKIVVLTTAGSAEHAEKIASRLLENKLAACVNIVPSVQSIYRWKGKVWKDIEHLLIIKTTSVLFDKVKKKIKQIHTYELPEIIALPIDMGDESVFKWIDDSVLKSSQKKKERKGMKK